MTWKDLSRAPEGRPVGLSTNEALMLLQLNRAITWFVSPERIMVLVSTEDGSGDWLHSEAPSLIQAVMKQRDGVVTRVKLSVANLIPRLIEPCSQATDIALQAAKDVG